MTQKAVVVRSGGKLMAQIVRSEACAQCRGCAFGETQTQLVPLPEKNGVTYREGDEVELTLSDGTLSRASLLAYGVPLAAFLIGLMLGARLSSALGLGSDAGAAIGALLLTGLSLLGLHFLEPRLKKSGRYFPTAAPCPASRAQDDSQDA